MLTAVKNGAKLQLSASGRWTASSAQTLDKLLSSIPIEPRDKAEISIDLQNVSAFDTFGAWYLARLVRHLQSSAHKPVIKNLPERYAGLFAAVEKASAGDDGAHSQSRFALSGLAAIGNATMESWRSLLLLLDMLGAVCASAVRALRKPASFRFTSTVHQIDRVAWQAIPIILLITFLIGCIIAQQGFFHFRKFGAEAYVVDMVGILVLREIGVLIVAIMVAGRSGSSYTAELGSMKMREEIDALRTMGFDPVDILILPRIVALVIALPILTFIGSMSALYGGELVAWLYGGMSPDIFVARLKEAISITHFKAGLIKAPFMALVIGIVACTAGLKVAGSAESLGLQTTSSVVTSIFLVIVLDGLFAIFFASIGM